MIRSEWNGDSLTVYLDGEIDHCASEHWRQEIEAELKKRPVSKLVLDFSDVYAQGLNPPISRLFRLAGLHRIITIQSGGQETYE